MTAFNDTFGIIGLSSENVGIDRRIYTGLTSTNPQLNVSYNGGRVDVYLNGVKLMGNHSGQSNYDYTYQNTGQGSAITLSTGVALVATDTIECVGYVSNSSNTVQTYNFNVTTNTTAFTASHTASSLVNVYLNGVLLDSSDYTLNGSNTVTLGSNAVNGDVVHIQVIGALDNSNFVPASGGTFSGDVGIGQSPGKKLDVGGDVRIRGDAGTLNFYRTTSPTDVATIEYNHSDSALKFWAKNKAINFSSADADQDSPHLYIKGTTGEIGINNTAPEADLHIGSYQSGSGQTATLRLSEGNGGGASTGFDIKYVGSSDNLIFNSKDGSGNFADRMTINRDSGNVTVNSGNLVIGTAGKGIDFSNASSGGNFTADNNILDDYEHGDYDATLTCDGGTISLSAYHCTYTKIGNFINVSGHLNISAVSSPSGNVRISLPYPAVSVDRSYEGTGCCIIYAANGQTGAFRTNNGTSLAGLNTFDYQTLNANNFSGDEEISFSLTYHTA